MKFFQKKIWFVLAFHLVLLIFVAVVFKVDDITNTYIITTDIEPLPLWFWLAMMGGVIVIMILSLVMVKVVKTKKIRANSREIDTYNMN